MLQFGGLDGVEELPASGAPVVREGRPRLPACAGEDGPGLAMRGGESFHGFPGGCMRAWTVMDRRGRRCSPRSSHGGWRRHETVGGERVAWPVTGPPS
jgi:hypothetical protein